MTYVVEKSRRSSRDIEEAFVFIAENDLDRGIYFLVAIEDTLTLISENPSIGWERSYQNSKLTGVRNWRVKGFTKFILIYQIDSQLNEIRLLRLVNLSRDLNQLDL